MKTKTTSKCHCNFCLYWSPIITRIRAALPAKLLVDFDNYVTHSMCAEMDGEVAEAKLDGSWPGWEWLPAEIEKRNKGKVHLRNKTPLSAHSSN